MRQSGARGQVEGSSKLTNRVTSAPLSVHPKRSDLRSAGSLTPSSSRSRLTWIPPVLGRMSERRGHLDPQARGELDRLRRLLPFPVVVEQKRNHARESFTRLIDFGGVVEIDLLQRRDGRERKKKKGGRRSVSASCLRFDPSGLCWCEDERD